MIEQHVSVDSQHSSTHCAHSHEIYCHCVTVIRVCITTLISLPASVHGNINVIISHMIAVRADIILLVPTCRDQTIVMVTRVAFAFLC